MCEATGFTSPVAGCPNALGAARAWPGEAGLLALRGAPWYLEEGQPKHTVKSAASRPAGLRVKGQAANAVGCCHVSGFGP